MWHEHVNVVQRAGPFSYVDVDGYRYSATYYEHVYQYAWGTNGMCSTRTKRIPIQVDGNGQSLGGEPEVTTCATRISGPSLAIESLTLRVGTEGKLRIRATNGAEPVKYKRVGVELELAPVNGRLSCDEFTDGGGELSCNYIAPRRRVAQTVKATCDNCSSPSVSTITVTPKPLIVGFFNGVGNTEKQVANGLAAIKNLAGVDYRDNPIRYEAFYNQTGAGVSSTMLQDIAETFMQRGSELDGVLQDRWEHYWDLISGRHSDPESLTGSLIVELQRRPSNGADQALASLIDSIFNATLGQIVAGWSRLLSAPPTEADLGAQIAKIRALADDESDFVLVAHSQGNLFVNAASDALRTAHPDTRAGVVHIAPASPTVRGPYGLSGFDLVINGLRVQGISSIQPANWNIPFSFVDASGHTLVATYLDAAREGRGRVKGLIESALASVRPEG